MTPSSSGVSQRTELELNVPRGRDHHLADLLEERWVIQAPLIRAKHYDFDDGELRVHKGFVGAVVGDHSEKTNDKNDG